jgi:hypothetical protein
MREVFIARTRTLAQSFAGASAGLSERASDVPIVAETDAGNLDLAQGRDIGDVRRRLR